MKKLWFLAGIIFFLVFSVCHANSNQATPDGSPNSPVIASLPEIVMSETAVKYGITAQNYPKINGSTSAFGIIWAIGKTMYDEKKHNSNLMEYARNLEERVGDIKEYMRTNEEYARNVKEYFNKYEEFLLKQYPSEPVQTVPSYEQLLNGELDMIIVPDPSLEILKLAKQKKVVLKFHPVAAEALIFITPKENTAENITLEQARKIYLNYAITNWAELGGPDRELIPICRNSDSGSQAQMDNLVLKNKKMHPDIEKNYVKLTMGSMLRLVANYHTGDQYYYQGELRDSDPKNSYALGYTLYTYFQHDLNNNLVPPVADKLKILKINGIVPDKATIANGSYPLGHKYYAVLRKNLPENHSARSIIKWLQSDEGVTAIAEMGYIPR